MLHKQIDVYSTNLVNRNPGGEGEIKEKTGKGFYLVHSFTYVQSPLYWAVIDT